MWGIFATLATLFAFERFVVWLGARRVLRTVGQMYAGGLATTSPDRHPAVDIPFYDRTEAALAREGFAKIGDVELEAMRQNPRRTRSCA